MADYIHSEGFQQEMEDRQTQHVYAERTRCNDTYGADSLAKINIPIHIESAGKFCPAYFDEITCWPQTVANSTASAPCAEHVFGMFGLIKNATATKFCTTEGTWASLNSSYTEPWTNYTQCYTTDSYELPTSNNKSLQLHESYLPIIKLISRTGYLVSLCTLIIAFIIMISIKKLHCPRNKLHMHLFASFIFRALLSLIKDLIFVEGVGPASHVKYENGSISLPYGEMSFECKLVTSLWEYFITANYSWILMEGLYLHNLIFRAMFADSNRKITHYIVLGWGLPMLVIIPWVIMRLSIEDTLCWTTHDKSIFLIIRIPTIISIIMNVLLFVRIAAVIFSKLRNPLYEEAMRYRKWARSTLVLAPLFGIHYALFLGMSINKNAIVEIVWLFMDQTFASSQGFFVAVLYCFMNSEVRTELKPHLYATLTCCATSDCLKHLFPCRDAYLRKSTTRGRTSVCTTMSCSSLYNNGFHRNSRTRCDIAGRSKHASIHCQDKSDHNCRLQGKTAFLQDRRISGSTNTSGCCSKSSLALSSHNSNINEKSGFLGDENNGKCCCIPVSATKPHEIIAMQAIGVK